MGGLAHKKDPTALPDRPEAGVDYENDRALLFLYQGGHGVRWRYLIECVVGAGSVHGGRKSPPISL